jgi:hypothetical protein
MLHSRRWFVGLTAIAAGSLALTGCSSSNSPSPDSGGKRFAGQTVEVAATWSGNEQAHFQAVLDKFAADTGASVRYTSGGNDLAVLLNTRLSGGAPPDIALIPQPGVVAQLAGKGALKELTGDAAQAVADHYSPAWKGLGTIDGKLYGVYFKVANKSVIWYRADALAAAGVKPPTTWEEFTAASKTIADSGTTPIVVPGADGWPLTDWFENVYLRVGGPDKYDELAAHELPWTDQSVVDTLALLNQYWHTARVVQGGPQGAVQVSFTQSVADAFGDKPKSAMLFEGDFVASEITKLGKFKVGDTAKFFDWPSINGSKPAVVTAGDQAVALTDRPVTMALMAYLASPEAANAMAAKGGFLSANSDLDPSAYPDDTTRQLGSSLVKAELLRFDLSDLTPQAFGGQTGASMWKGLQEFLANPAADPAATAAKLEAAAVKDYRSK